MRPAPDEFPRIAIPLPAFRTAGGSRGTRGGGPLRAFLPIAFAGLAIAQEPAGEDLLRADRERIESRPPLLAPERELYRKAAAGDPATLPKRVFLLAVVPVAFEDAPGEETPAVAAKLRERLAAESGGKLEILIWSAPRVVVPEFRILFEARRLGSKEEAHAVSEWLAQAEVPAVVDGICFAYAGELSKDTDGILWPHQTKTRLDGKQVPYFLAPQDGERAVSIHLHEFLHALGLPDKREKGRAHCIMTCGHEELPLCAACRYLLGWIAPARTTPEPAAPFRLRPFKTTGDALLVEVAKGAEELLLEHRDDSVLVWLVTRSSTTFLAELDGKTSDRLTPYSIPGFRGRSPGSRPVFLTDVRVEAGEAWFRISGQEPLTDLEQYHLASRARSCDPRRR